MTYQTIAVEQDASTSVIRLIRQADGNRVDRLLIGEVRDAVEHAADEQATRAILLLGGPPFSLGWGSDLLDELGAGTAPEPGLLGSTFQFLAEAPLPVIAVIAGDAFSAGFELALACDLRLAASGARFGLPDTAEGRIPMAGGTQRLARLTGRGLATEMILTGRVLDADEALQAGLVGAVVQPDDLLNAALALAGSIARRGPLAVRLAKEAILHGQDMPLGQALRYETDLTVLLQTTADRAEGVRAFIEKREPRFCG